MLDLEVIDDPAAAVVALDPLRARLLAGLAEPASASALAQQVGLPRQKVNYHLRILEDHGLVTEVGQRRWGGLTERMLHATAASYVVSPGALGEVRRADQAGKRLPTLALDTEIRFRSAAERAAFTSDLADAVAVLVSRYHDAGAPGGRSHRLVVVAHPVPAGTRPDTEEAS
jgi:DNA-binding transcriptional ArsR family regulator